MALTHVELWFSACVILSSRDGKLTLSAHKFISVYHKNSAFRKSCLWIRKKSLLHFAYFCEKQEKKPKIYLLLREKLVIIKRLKEHI